MHRRKWNNFKAYAALQRELRAEWRASKKAPFRGQLRGLRYGRCGVLPDGARDGRGLGSGHAALCPEENGGGGGRSQGSPTEDVAEIMSLAFHSLKTSQQG